MQRRILVLFLALVTTGCGHARPQAPPSPPQETPGILVCEQSYVSATAPQLCSRIPAGWVPVEASTTMILIGPQEAGQRVGQIMTIVGPAGGCSARSAFNNTALSNVPEFMFPGIKTSKDGLRASAELVRVNGKEDDARARWVVRRIPAHGNAPDTIIASYAIWHKDFDARSSQEQDAFVDSFAYK